MRRRVRTKGRGPHGPAPKVAEAPLAPEDDTDLQEYEPSLPEGPEVSSLEPRRIALPLPGQEVSRASPQYQRMLEKLNNDVELYKLHVKHYHMSPAQFRRRTQVRSMTSTTELSRAVVFVALPCLRLREPESQDCEHRHSVI